MISWSVQILGDSASSLETASLAGGLLVIGSWSNASRVSLALGGDTPVLAPFVGWSADGRCRGALSAWEWVGTVDRADWMEGMQNKDSNQQVFDVLHDFKEAVTFKLVRR